MCKVSALSVVSLILILAAPPARSGAGDEVFKGEIADSQCALNVHSLSQSHREMLDGKVAGTTNADCVRYCVQERGGRFVLQNKDRVFKLDNQELSREFAAQSVIIAGTLDAKTNTIHVRTIKLASGAEKTALQSK